MDKKTGRREQSELAHIRQSIQDILFTPIGSRIARRDYGSSIFEFLDAPISAVLLLQISSSVVQAIEKWEPRVKVSQAKIHFLKNKLLLELTLFVKGKPATLAPIVLKDRE